MNRGYACLVRLVLVALLGSVHSLAAASTIWQYTSAHAGDTVGVGDLNDLGAILYNGFSDAFPGGASAIGHPPDYEHEYIQGYGIFPPLYNPPEAGVQVTDINDAGDAYGTAIRPDGVRVPTMWIGGVPFDLTDPANAGLHFNYDPGQKYITDFDLWSLPVVGFPFTPGEAIVSSFAYTNVRHDYVFNFTLGSQDFYGLLTAVVPEPGTLVLVLAGLAAASLGARGRCIGTSKRALIQRQFGIDDVIPQDSEERFVIPSAPRTNEAFARVVRPGRMRPLIRAAIMNRGYACLVRLVLVVLLGSVHSLAAASTMYWQFTTFLYGDTVAVSDLNDLGVVLFTGFGDRLPDGGSAIGRPPHYTFEAFEGYGIFPPSYSSANGVHVTDINDAGDAYGSAIRPDGVSVPTIWIGGVPFDLTDPANAGLQFNYDPGQKYVTDFDLWSLPVVGLPFGPGSVEVSSFAYTNVHHDYIFQMHSGLTGFDSYGLLTAVVPEPGTLVLVLAGLAAASLGARGRCIGTSKRALIQRQFGIDDVIPQDSEERFVIPSAPRTNEAFARVVRPGRMRPLIRAAVEGTINTSTYRRPRPQGRAADHPIRAEQRLRCLFGREES